MIQQLLLKNGFGFGIILFIVLLKVRNKEINDSVYSKEEVKEIKKKLLINKNQLKKN